MVTSVFDINTTINFDKTITLGGQDIDIDNISDIYWDGKHEGVSYWDATELLIYLKNSAEIPVDPYKLDPYTEDALATFLGL